MSNKLLANLLVSIWAVVAAAAVIYIGKEIGGTLGCVFAFGFGMMIDRTIR